VVTAPNRRPTGRWFDSQCLLRILLESNALFLGFLFASCVSRPRPRPNLISEPQIHLHVKTVLQAKGSLPVRIGVMLIQVRWLDDLLPCALHKVLHASFVPRFLTVIVERSPSPISPRVDQVHITPIRYRVSSRSTRIGCIRCAAGAFKTTQRCTQGCSTFLHVC
jgi:hypothetical protein